MRATRALIIDDEALARGRLRKMLAHEPGVEVIGECSNGPEAISSIQVHQPDLIFLDVQMPEVNGFDVLRALPEGAIPAVVFVTAHERHAVEAFEVHAMDYLLKPFTQVRLREALRRARDQLERRSTDGLARLVESLRSLKAQPAYLSRIAVKNGPQTLFIKVEEVDYVESASNYVVLQTRGGNHILRETLTNLESQLPPQLFLRISRSLLVNLKRVKGLQYNPEGEWLVVLEDGKQLLMTRAVREVQQRLQFAQVP